MKIEIDGDTIRIKGKNAGDNRHIKIYASDTDCKDRYFITLVKDGFEIGCLPNIVIDKDYVVIDGEIKK